MIKKNWGLKILSTFFFLSIIIITKDIYKNTVMAIRHINEIEFFLQEKKLKVSKTNFFPHHLAFISLFFLFLPSLWEKNRANRLVFFSHFSSSRYPGRRVAGRRIEDSFICLKLLGIFFFLISFFFLSNTRGCTNILFYFHRPGVGNCLDALQLIERRDTSWRGGRRNILQVEKNAHHLGSRFLQKCFALMSIVLQIWIFLGVVPRGGNNFWILCFDISGISY